MYDLCSYMMSWSADGLLRNYLKQINQKNKTRKTHQHLIHSLIMMTIMTKNIWIGTKILTDNKTLTLLMIESMRTKRWKDKIWCREKGEDDVKTRHWHGERESVDGVRRGESVFATILFFVFCVSVAPYWRGGGAGGGH